MVQERSKNVSNGVIVVKVSPRFFGNGTHLVFVWPTCKNDLVLPVAVVVVLCCFFSSHQPGESTVLWSCSVRSGFRCVKFWI